jgi:glycerophosphoryl diester phosphodiesterase
LLSLPFRHALLLIEDHRHTRGLAPENTLTAFHRTIENNMTTNATDTKVTSNY